MCTCPEKYSFSPYTGCSHACLYCYISSYIPDAFHARLKKDLFRRLKREVKKIDKNLYVSMSNSSDPYTPEEKELMATRKCLRILRENDIMLLIITKSDIVARDIDIISDMRASISMTLTGVNNERMAKIEKFAPSFQKRLEAMQELHENGVPCSFRLDPIIPGVNDEEIEDIVREGSRYCSHVVTSTIKPRADSMKRLKAVLPHISSMKFERIGNSYYLPKQIRFELLKRVEEASRKYGISFATCREGYPFTAKSCDGSHLIPRG
ncbi:MAG: radical SAM protein [Thermoplasmata archaeon]|nr:radical SAM protein [Thermoplasmata archaeon]